MPMQYPRDFRRAGDLVLRNERFRSRPAFAPSHVALDSYDWHVLAPILLASVHGAFAWERRVRDEPHNEF